MVQDVARLSRLQAQLSHPVSGHAYDLRQPPFGWTQDAAKSPLALDRMQREWTHLKSVAAASPEQQRHLLWFSFALADAYDRSNRPLQERAVLETALDLLSDAGHRHLVRCRLAREAVSLGDLEAAQAWLDECDPAPELIDLDSAYRLALAEVHHARRNPSGVLTTVGAQAGNVPIHPTVDFDVSLLRVHALEVLGHREEARGQLWNLVGTWGDDAVMEQLEARKLAPQGLRDLRDNRVNRIRSHIAALDENRGVLPTGLRAMTAPLTGLPLLALVIWVAVTIPRCTFDVDPFVGVQGHVLCPLRCPDCHGPWRIYTPWSHMGGESSTNGPRYFCPTPTSRIDRMSRGEWENSWHTVQNRELNVAPFGSTLLLAMILVLPIVPIGALSVHRKSKRTREELTDEIEKLSISIREIAPPFRSRGSYKPLLLSMLWVLVPVVVCMLLIAVEFL
jgi:hypothetical protein